MEKPPFTIQAQFARYGSTADRGMSLNFRTAELSAEEQTKVAGYVHDEGWLLFSSNPLNNSDIPQDKAPAWESKSPSQRQRGVMFIWWKKQIERGLRTDSFDQCYNTEINASIERYKAELD